jgi:predicted transcriptional regulator
VPATPTRRAGSGPVPGEEVPREVEVGWPYGLEVRARAVGLVGVGRPVGEVARLVGVHPGTVHRWVREATRRWADPADAAAGEDGEQPTDLGPSAG